MKELTLAAKSENVEQVINFINDELEKADCPIKAQMQLDIAIDELFSNIAYYAYGDGNGDATVTIDFENEPKSVVISFTDSGIQYDPLKREDPDVTLSADEREIGGLGIFLVKKSMDSIEYEYKDGKNILTIKKNM